MWSGTKHLRTSICDATTEIRLRFRSDSPHELSSLSTTMTWCLRGGRRCPDFKSKCCGYGSARSDAIGVHVVARDSLRYCHDGFADWPLNFSAPLSFCQKRKRCRFAWSTMYMSGDAAGEGPYRLSFIVFERFL